MKKLILAITLAASAVAASAANKQPEDLLTKVSRQISELPDAAQGVAFGMAVAKLDMHCQVPPSFTKAVQQATVRLANYAAPSVSKDDLAKAIGLGSQISMLMAAQPNFNCQTSGLVQGSGSLPQQIDAEIKRAPNPKNFDIGRVAPMLKH